MSTLARKLILAALGILVGAAVWPAAELVNEKKIQDSRLKYGDVLAIGPARLFFKYE